MGLNRKSFPKDRLCAHSDIVKEILNFSSFTDNFFAFQPKKTQLAPLFQKIASNSKMLRVFLTPSLCCVRILIPTENDYHYQD